MRTRLSFHRSDRRLSGSPEPPATGEELPPQPAGDGHVEAAPVEPVTEDRASTWWPKALTARAIGSAWHYLVAAPSRVWARRTEARRGRLQIGSGQEVMVADMRGHEESAAVAMLKAVGLAPGRRGEDYADGVAAGHIMRTRPPTGSLVAMGTSVDYVVASSVSGSPGEPLADSDIFDHDASARLKHEAP